MITIPDQCASISTGREVIFHPSPKKIEKIIRRRVRYRRMPESLVQAMGHLAGMTGPEDQMVCVLRAIITEEICGAGVSPKRPLLRTLRRKARLILRAISKPREGGIRDDFFRRLIFQTYPEWIEPQI